MEPTGGTGTPRSEDTVTVQGEIIEKFAIIIITIIGALMSTVQGLSVPEAPPDQLLNTNPAPGTAVNC
jgi:hypothetical protein